MKNRKVAFIKEVNYITDVYPTNPLLSSNGGDYFFGRRIYNILFYHENSFHKIENITTYWTSADFSYDEIDGDFKDTIYKQCAICVNDTIYPLVEITKNYNFPPFCLHVSKKHYEDDDYAIMKTITI